MDERFYFRMTARECERLEPNVHVVRSMVRLWCVRRNKKPGPGQDEIQVSSSGNVANGGAGILLGWMVLIDIPLFGSPLISPLYLFASLFRDIISRHRRYRLAHTVQGDFHLHGRERPPRWC
jgi:hypothetical protein